MDSVIHLLNNWSLGCSWIHVIHSRIPFVHRNLIVMLAHPAGDDVTTSITLSRFSVSYLSIARPVPAFFVPLLPRIRIRTKIVTLKWSFTTTKSRLPEVVILRKCLGKPQIRLKLQHIKGVSWLLAGPRASHPTESTDENSANHLIGECSKYKRNPTRLINSAGASWEFFVIYLESNWKVKKS